MKIKGREVVEGKAHGEILISEEPIGFYGSVDIETGEFIEEGHQLEGKNISGKILVFPKGKGSTVGSYVIYGLAKNGKAPAAIVNEETETIVATGCILGEIPCIDNPDKDIFKVLEDGSEAHLDTNKGFLEV